MQFFNFDLIVFGLPNLTGKHTRQALDRLPFPSRHRRRIDFVLAAISCVVPSPRSASIATLALNLSEKLRLLVILYPVFAIGYILTRWPILQEHFKQRYYRHK